MKKNYIKACSKLAILIVSVFVFSSCDDDDKNKGDFSSSNLVGKWKMYQRIENGAPKVYDMNNTCALDRIIEFLPDGTAKANNPCDWNNDVEASCNWNLNGEILEFSKYLLPDMVAYPQVASLTRDTLKLNFMWGTNLTVQQVYYKVNETVSDYAQEVSGKFEGRAYFSKWYVDQNSSYRGDSVESTIQITRRNWGNVSIKFNDIHFFETVMDFKLDSVQVVERRYVERELHYNYEYGLNSLLVGDSRYHVRSFGYLNKNNDSLFIDVQLLQFNDVGEYAWMHYNSFKGRRVSN